MVFPLLPLRRQTVSTAPPAELERIVCLLPKPALPCKPRFHAKWEPRRVPSTSSITPSPGRAGRGLAAGLIGSLLPTRRLARSSQLPCQHPHSSGRRNRLAGDTEPQDGHHDRRRPWDQRRNRRKTPWMTWGHVPRRRFTNSPTSPRGPRLSRFPALRQAPPERCR